MNNIELIDTVLSSEGKQYLVGWNIETNEVYISKETVNIKWIDILRSATTEREAKQYAKEFIN